MYAVPLPSHLAGHGPCPHVTLKNPIHLDINLARVPARACSQ